MKCTRCYGTGSVMTYDPGICGAEEYGTCGLCKGTGTLPPELEALYNNLTKLEDKVHELGDKVHELGDKVHELEDRNEQS